MLRCYLLAGILLLPLTGCYLHADPGRATIRTQGVEVEIDADGRPGHCPPGHAKKGWC